MIRLRWFIAGAFAGAAITACVWCCVISKPTPPKPVATYWPKYVRIRIVGTGGPLRAQIFPVHDSVGVTPFGAVAR